MMVRMIQIEKKRRDEIKKVVLAALMHTPSFCELPVKIKQISRSFANIRLITYSKQMNLLNMSYNNVLQYLQSSDACTDYYPETDMYYIYYNNLDKNINTSFRFRWNIAHELGHVLLKHHIAYDKTRIFRSSLSDSEYDYLEAEADYFAQLILVPHSPLYAFKIASQNNIKYLCHISRPAAYKRFIAYQQWKKNINPDDSYDRYIFFLYYNYLFKKKCTCCGAMLVQEKGAYCPICGNKTLQWGDGIMKYPKIEAYDSGKIKKCPVCDNEETDIEGNYCQICKTYLVNMCTNEKCKNITPLPTNARYCPICGGRSEFLNSEILKAWDFPLERGFFNIPDGVEDEGLPFN